MWFIRTVAISGCLPIVIVDTRCVFGGVLWHELLKRRFIHFVKYGKDGCIKLCLNVIKLYDEFLHSAQCSHWVA